jgi:hypothetical protein
MTHLTRKDLYSLEQYAEGRPSFRARVMAHKTHRRVPIGDHAALYFEDALTVQYQVQEMLRIERVFEGGAIQEELDIYNPLIPDGSNWKATFMLEYPEVKERTAALARLIGVERALYMQIEGFERVIAIANEDLERETEEKTASVHFVRFELTAEMVRAAQHDAWIKAGIHHPAYRAETVISGAFRTSLQADLH